ncbi:uncharacterized protein LOC122318045 [Carya illinoinensis]|uniref:Uncharacterized protein n=1 Tax=Carya illinoinensis TaxID=32201 RepID=A0A8T1PW15_CARIL|nr:uncharacterized protein LOC122318045 [Carya illinoinensis]KAG6644490.1 hypothetical protein CIPAW_08G057300 [Carya illinoinensis]
MEEIRSSPPPAAASDKRKPQSSAAMSIVKKDCLWFATSMQEGFRYVKASFTGLAKKMTARNEREASEADLKAAKMQVEATDAAEETKKRLEKTM